MGGSRMRAARLVKGKEHRLLAGKARVEVAFITFDSRILMNCAGKSSPLYRCESLEEILGLPIFLKVSSIGRVVESISFKSLITRGLFTPSKSSTTQSGSAEVKMSVLSIV